MCTEHHEGAVAGDVVVGEFAVGIRVGGDHLARGAADLHGQRVPGADHLEHLAQRDTPFISWIPGRSQSPETLSNLVPVDPVVPIAANQSAPISMIRATAANVSTLFTHVGLPRNPSSTGKGGFNCGVPRLPSQDSMSADSSPQMYAPAPISMRRSNRSPSNPSSRSSASCCSRYSLR